MNDKERRHAYYLRNKTKIITRQLKYYHDNKNKIKQKYDYEKISRYNREYYLNVTKNKIKQKYNDIQKIFYPNHRIKNTKEKIIHDKIRCECCHKWMNEINYDNHKNSPRCVPIKVKPNNKKRLTPSSYDLFDCKLCNLTNLHYSEYKIHCNKAKHLRRVENQAMQSNETDKLAIYFD